MAFEVVPGITLGHRRARLRRHPRHAAPLVHVVHGRHRPRGPGGGRRRLGRLASRRPGRRHDRDPHGRGPASGASPRSCIAGGLDPTPRWPRCGGAPGPSRRPSGPRWPRSPTATLATPSVIVVGEVAAVDLAWFERRPLFGRRVVVTRTRAAGVGAVARRCATLGAEPIEVPVIEIADPADGGAALRAAVALARHLRLGRRHLAERRRAAPGALRDAGLDARAFGARPGRGHRAGHRRGAGRRRRRADLVPERFVAESLLDAMADARDRRAGCCSRGPRWRATCSPTACAPAAGTSTSSTPTAPCPPSVTDEQRAAVAGADVDHLHLVVHRRPLRRRGRRRARCRRSSPASARSPPRPRAAHGLTVDVEAEVHTIDGLVDALVAWARR